MIFTNLQVQLWLKYIYFYVLMFVYSYIHCWLFKMLFVQINLHGVELDVEKIMIVEDKT
jgi:hypothetical protein